MAKHGGTRGRYTGRRTKLLKGQINEALVLGTLAANTLVGVNFDEAVSDRSFLLSMEAIWSLRDATSLEGGVMVGIAHNDYTDAEIEETIEATGSWDEGDLVQQERAKRKIRRIGTFGGLASDLVLNDGKPIKTKLMFSISEGQTLKLWAYNLTGAALTTGSVVHAEGHVWIRPS